MARRKALNRGAKSAQRLQMRLPYGVDRTITSDGEVLLVRTQLNREMASRVYGWVRRRVGVLRGSTRDLATLDVKAGFDK